jgi:RNA polymerase sigma factor (TIGR02999 family)
MDEPKRSPADLTRQLRAWSAGDASALEQLTPIVYAELYRLASFQMAGEREGHLMQPSALVNEAFLRLIANQSMEWSGRAQFFAFSARLMRRILIDFARAQNTGKRGRRVPHVDLSGIHNVAGDVPYPVDFLDLDAALSELAKLDARQAHVVELRYFGGLENEEVAAVLGVSEPTVVREWRAARAWLFDRLRTQAGDKS